MTASASQPRDVGRERIIERPRLMKLLDETDARTILLLAPAGYGKTTLARQWAKTLTSSVWVSLTAAHSDVAWLAEDLARLAGGEGGPAARSIREHIRARSNPQRAARELGAALVEHFGSADFRWLILDDYHEIGASPEAEELIATVERECGARVLIASRRRPTWASGRRFVYGEIFEVTRMELAMTQQEAVEVLGRRPSTEHLSEQAEGWPAVIGLAAAAQSAVVPKNAVPQALHRYLAEELFQRASSQLREGLLRLALRPARDSHGLELAFGLDAERIVAEAEVLGFGSRGDAVFGLHPLLQEFLLEKLLALPDADERVRAAVEGNIQDAAWDHALGLILRFGLSDLVESTLSLAFKPLVRDGRLATLASFAAETQRSSAPRAPSASIVGAEVAFRDGNFDLAIDLLEGVRARLMSDHPLASRAAALEGRIHFLRANFTGADDAFVAARESAADDRDAAEAAYGLASAKIFGEKPRAASAVEELRLSKDRSPIDFLRFVSSEIALRLLGRTSDGLSGNLHLESARQLLPHAEDPRVRTGLTYTVASALTQRGDYTAARDWLAAFFSDADEFDLEFAKPYANWTYAQIALGQRRFGEAERALQAIEDTAARTQEHHHLLNAKALRARLMLQTRDFDAAVRYVAPKPEVQLIPSWLGEYLATRALALACAGEFDAALEAATDAHKTSAALEVRGLVLAARAIVQLQKPGAARTRDLAGLIRMARLLEVWDPVVCAVRAAPALADAIATQESLRPALEDLYRRTGDYALARRTGLRTRATGQPRDLLSPREYEILGLIARGLKNRDISRALFIADSTTKVHVRHILEKLGVHTRAEAVARLKMFEEN
jgi:LuxR family transcriptional regulator, maltose regulon positive regulatory protein